MHPNLRWGADAALADEEKLVKDGYTCRSLLTCEMAEKLNAIVFDNGAPDLDPSAKLNVSVAASGNTNEVNVAIRDMNYQEIVFAPALTPVQNNLGTKARR
ncbi:MAG: hypothetical protein LBT74_05940 [Acidobacteriota bacterium]|nr:hypothetical protein [Acidobacteriota bacterium]